MGWSDTMYGTSLSLVQDTSAGQIINVVDNVPGGGDFNFDLGVMSRDAMDVKVYVNDEEQDINIGEDEKERNEFTLPDEDSVEIIWEFPSTDSSRFMLDVYRYEPPEATDVLISEQFLGNSFDLSWTTGLFPPIRKLAEVPVESLTNHADLIDESMRDEELNYNHGEDIYREMDIAFSSTMPWDLYVFLSHWVPSGADTDLFELAFISTSTGRVYFADMEDIQTALELSEVQTLYDIMNTVNRGEGDLWDDPVDGIKIFYSLQAW